MRTLCPTFLFLASFFSLGLLAQQPVGSSDPHPAEARTPGATAAVDLRPTFDKLGLIPRQQGARPTCSVFTVAGALEFAVAKRQGHTPRFSVEFLNWAANKACGDTDDGGFFSDLWKGFAAFWRETSAGRSATQFCSTPARPCLLPGKPNRSWKAGHWRRRQLTAAKRRQNSRNLLIDSVRRVFHRLGRRGFLEFQRGVMQTQIVLRGFVALPRGLDEPLHRLLLVLFHAAAGLVKQAKIALGGRAFLFGGGEIPSGGLLVVLRHHLAGFVKDSEIELCGGITAFRRFAIPFHRLGVILRHALAGFVKHAEVEPRRRVALLRRFAQPFGRLAIFLRHARAVQVADAEITLRHRIILVRRPAEPLDRLLVILRHALAVLVADAKIALRLRVALLGGLAHCLKRLPCAAAGHFSGSFSCHA